MEPEKKNIFFARSTFTAELFTLWRILVVIHLAQISAGCLAFVIKPYDYWFANFWFGGAIATIFGFSLGLLWQKKHDKDTWKNHRTMLLLLGFISLALFIAALTFPLEKLTPSQKPIPTTQVQ